VRDRVAIGLAHRRRVKYPQLRADAVESSAGIWIQRNDGRAAANRTEERAKIRFDALVLCAPVSRCAATAGPDRASGRGSGRARSGEIRRSEIGEVGPERRDLFDAGGRRAWNRREHLRRLVEGFRRVNLLRVD
jgi:hypothetical protein